MKNIIIILFVNVLFAGSAWAQVQKPDKNGQMVFKSSEKINIKNERNVYIKDEDINKFVGVWKWKQGDDVIVLNLQKASKNFGTTSQPLVLDLIRGTYQYISGGKVVKSIGNEYITGSSQGKSNVLFLTIYDPATKKNTEYQLVPDQNGSVNLVLNKVRGERLRTANTSSIPTNITLNKEASVY